MFKKCLILRIAFAGLMILQANGNITLENCPRYISISKLFVPSTDIEDLKKASSQIQALDWKRCFLSCCYLASCSEVFYGARTGCIHVKCNGAFGVCKYRPSGLKDSSVHGIITEWQHPDIPLLEQLDQLQFRNGPSLVTSDMRFTYVQQCAQYVEPENVTGVAEGWVTKRFFPFPYLYQTPRAVPPLGMRSAVPLGGLGTGSFELRADGSFTEWTVENQSPGGSAKLSRGALDLAFLAVQVRTPKGERASVLRTHPPHGLPGVRGLSYSGAFPVSKLMIEDNGFFGVQMELYAYGSLHARNASASALPAVFFTLRVRNPTTDSANVSLLLNLPLGEQPDTSREGKSFKVVKGVKAPSVCAELCQNYSNCKAWSLTNGSCELKKRMPLHAYQRGTTSGVKGFWGSSHDSLTCGRPGRYPNSGSTTIMLVNNDYRRDGRGNNNDDKNSKNNNNNSNSSNKDKNQNKSNNTNNGRSSKNGSNFSNDNTYTVRKKKNSQRRNKKRNTKKRASNNRKSDREKTKRTTRAFSSGVSYHFKEIWDAFEKHGHLHNMVGRDTGFHGSGVSRISLGPGEEGTITLVMAWHYPYRDHAGETVGQYYGNIFHSSEETALHAKENVKDILNELISYRENMMPPRAPKNLLSNSLQEIFRVDSSLPDWLQDMLVNSLSYWRTGFWVADGRWRQWETFDCNDVDSVHNDFQRELPYMLFFPGLLENVVRAWARSQLPSGIIPEALQGQFGCWRKTNKLDSVGGRYNMADVHPAFIAQVYHLYIWAGKEQLLSDLWPAVFKATQWMIIEGTNGTGLPLRMTNTYDILQLQQYDHAFYNSVMFLLGLRAAEEMAEVQQDVDAYLLIRDAMAKALERIEQLFWDDERGYYHAWWDSKKGSPPWLMADSLYGQVWAYTLGLGHLLDPEKMKSHLRKEILLNDTPYGLQVMTTNKGDVTQVTRRKRDITEQQSRRDMDFNQYFENLQQNSYYFIPKYRDLNYENEEYERTLDADDNAYGGQVWDVYPNTQPANQYGYAVGQNQGIQAIAEWDKYYQDLNEDNVPIIDQYWTSSSPEQEYAGLQLDNSESVTASRQKDLEEERNDNVRLTSRKEKLTMNKEFDSSSTGNVIKTSKQTVKTKGTTVSKPSKSSNCSLLRKHSIHKSIWMGASADWTALQIHLGMAPYKALEQAKKSLLHYRDDLNDLWNIHGLTAGSGYGLDGQPWCTSHYTFHMVLWHIPFALSGQQYSIIERSLSFSPRVQVPYALPFFVPYASGSIEAIHSSYGRTVVYKVSVTHGYLVLKSLVISGTVWPGEVLKLEKGESVMWS